jgi:hypothetical protein
MSLRRRFGVAIPLSFIAAVAPAQQLVREIVGQDPGDAFGACVASGGDLDGDGVSELLISTRAIDPNGRSVYAVEVFSGASSTLLRTHFGSATTMLGAATAFVGDADGDGVADYLCDGPDRTAVTHEAWLYSGASGALIRSCALTVASDGELSHVRALEDVDGDGIADFAVSDSGPSGGHVDVVSIASGTIVHTIAAARPYYAEDFSTLPDQDGDGIDDLALCEWTNIAKHGVVWIHSALSGAKLGEFDGQKGDGFARTAARLHDVDGDGLDEFMVGAILANGAQSRSGAVFVYSGGTHKILAWLAEGSTMSQFGSWVADAGDVNGDGVHDIAVAAPGVFGTTDRYGPAFLFSGKTMGLLYRFEFPSTMNWAGDGFANAGDVDGDSFDDLAIGDPEQLTAAPGTGRVRIYAGNDLHLLATPRAPAASAVLSLVAREGATTQLALTALVDVSGTPLFIPLGGLGFFDGTGQWGFSSLVPPGLSGLELTFQSFAQRPTGRGLRGKGNTGVSRGQ